MTLALPRRLAPAPVALDAVIEGDAAAELRRFPAASVHLTVTSPPYGGLRAYGGDAFDFGRIAAHLYRVTAPGGVLVWVVADPCEPVTAARPGKSGASARQMLHFMDLGFTLHDEMIARWPNKMPRQKYRYEQVYDKMFVFCKGPRPRVARIRRVPCAHAGHVVRLRTGKATDQVGAYRDRGGPRRAVRTNADKPDGNVWEYATGLYQTSGDPMTWDHPAPFPEALARDHILSWSDPGDVVLDPLCGSGTTLKMAAVEGRRWVGIEVCPQYADIARRRTDLYRPASEPAVLVAVPPPPAKVRARPEKKTPPPFEWAADEATVGLVEFAKLARRTPDAVRMLAYRKRVPARKRGRAWEFPVRAAALCRPPQNRRWGGRAPHPAARTHESDRTAGCGPR